MAHRFDPASQDQARYSSFLQASIPDPRDGEVAELLSALTASGGDHIADASLTASDAGRSVLRAFAQRSAAASVRDGSQDHLVRSLLALCIAGLADGNRESLMTMAAVDDAATRTGARLPQLVATVGEIVNDQARVALVQWLARDPSTRSLSSMGLEALDEDDGFRYRSVLEGSIPEETLKRWAEHTERN